MVGLITGSSVLPQKMHTATTKSALTVRAAHLGPLLGEVTGRGWGGKAWLFIKGPETLEKHQNMLSCITARLLIGTNGRKAGRLDQRRGVQYFVGSASCIFMKYVFYLFRGFLFVVRLIVCWGQYFDAYAGVVSVAKAVSTQYQNTALRC